MFTPATEAYAKRMARSLRETLGRHGFEAGHSECLETLSRMFGHVGWLSMQRAVRRGGQSTLFDQDLPREDILVRRAHQVAAICDLGVEISTARCVAAEIDASSRSTTGKLHQLEKIRFLVDTGGMEEAEAVAYEGLHRGDTDIFKLVLELSRDDPRWRHVGAIALLLGHGTPRDPKTAADMLEKLLTADIEDRRKGFVAATLGDIAAGKHGLPEDHQKELRYYRLAALTYDHPAAAFNLGLRYQSSSPPNLVAAADMFALAVREGSIEAATNLGLLLIHHGIYRQGVDPFIHLEVASRFGDGVATTALEELSKTNAEAVYRKGGKIYLIGRKEPSVLDKLVGTWSVVLGKHGWTTTVDGDALVVRKADGSTFRVPVWIRGADSAPSNFDLVLLSHPIMEQHGSHGYILRIGVRNRGEDRFPAYLVRGDTGATDFGKSEAISMTYMEADRLTNRFSSTVLEIGEYA
jgi:hypothetical protein